LPEMIIPVRNVASVGAGYTHTMCFPSQIFPNTESNQGMGLLFARIATCSITNLRETDDRRSATRNVLNV